MKSFLRFSMAALIVVMGFGLFSRTAIGLGEYGDEKWFGPVLHVGDQSIGIGLRVAWAVDEESALENPTNSACSSDAGDLILVMMPDRTVAVVDSAVDDSREER